MFGVLLAFLFIFLNGFFVAAEFAFVKTRATQLTARIQKGERRARVAQVVLERLDRYLSVTQFGVTLASLGLGWIGEPAIESVVAGGLHRLGVHTEGTTLHYVVIITSFGILTFSHVLFGELVPKLIAIQRSESTALASAIPLRFLYVCFKPLLWVLEITSTLILKLMGISGSHMNEGALSEDEILGILAANTARSEGGRDKVQLLERVLRFSERTAKHAMVPRVDVAFLPINKQGPEVIQFLRLHQYSRVLLTKEKSLDAIEGYVYTKEILLDKNHMDAADLRNFRRDILFVPESQGLVDVLRHMQAEQTHIAVVVDEYGGTSGIVTLEDLLEEIVGEIRDEFDVEPSNIVSVPNEPHTWDVHAHLMMDELKSIGVIVSSEHASVSIGALMLEKIGRLPKKGDSVEIARNASATISHLVKRRIMRVRITITPDESAPSL